MVNIWRRYGMNQHLLQRMDRMMKYPHLLNSCNNCNVWGMDSYRRNEVSQVERISVRKKHVLTIPILHDPSNVQSEVG